LPTFRECFEELARRAVQETASYEQYLLELAERECQARWAKRTERLLRDSRLPLEKDLASFDMGRLPAKVWGFLLSHPAAGVASALHCHFRAITPKSLHTDCIRMALHQRKRTRGKSS
jgi:hypothetical protein